MCVRIRATTSASGGRPTRKFTLVDTVDVDETPKNPGENNGSGNVDNVAGQDDDWGEV